MLAYQNLKDIIVKAIAWETELKGFYEVAEVALRNPESRKLVVVLGEKLAERLRILKELDVRKFGNVEWVRFASVYRDDEMVPKKTISRDSGPDEIFNAILSVDEKLQRFYEELARNLVSRSQKDLFQSLALFKSEQIESIKDTWRLQGIAPRNSMHASPSDPTNLNRVIGWFIALRWAACAGVIVAVSSVAAFFPLPMPYVAIGVVTAVLIAVNVLFTLYFAVLRRRSLAARETGPFLTLQVWCDYALLFVLVHLGGLVKTLSPTTSSFT